jgi:uncharacterized alpha-E superfamily protein
MTISDELVEKAAEAIELCDKPYSSEHLARAVLSAVLPDYRNETIEECARVADKAAHDVREHFSGDMARGASSLAEDIAIAIRSLLKEKEIG